MQTGLDEPRVRALLAYYRALAEKAVRATRKEMLPEIPDAEELEYVDGWVVWNGRPVWRYDEEVPAVPAPQAGTVNLSTADAAWLATLDQWMAAVEESAERGSESPPAAGRVAAERRFYSSLGEQARRAMRGEGPVPEVPPRAELDFVDGWLVWKGEPVWWSGLSADVRPVPSPPSTGGGSAAASSPPTRPRLRRLLALPWRRAAA